MYANPEAAPGGKIPGSPSASRGNSPMQRQGSLSAIKRRHNSVSFVSAASKIPSDTEAQSRAFKELLEECSRTLTKNKK